MRLSSTARMLSMNTETSKPLEKFHIYSLHLRSTIAHCIYCAVYCQLKYSMKILKHLLSILKLYIILDISCTLLVYNFRSSEYLHSRNQDFVQMCKYLVLYDCLLLCYFYWCIVVLGVLLAVVVIVLLSPKINLCLSAHCVTVQYVPHNLNISYRRHVCNCRRNDRTSYTKYTVIITVCLRTAVYGVHQLPSVNKQLQSYHVII